MLHDRAAHGEALALAALPSTCCSVTGLSAFILAKIGDVLSVDRIDSRKGYVVGNMQIISLRLNNAKGAGTSIPALAVEMLKRRIERVTNDKWTKRPTQEGPDDTDTREVAGG